MLDFKKIQLAQLLSVAFLIFFILNIKVHFPSYTHLKVVLFTGLILSYFFWFTSSTKFLFYAVLTSSIILLTRIIIYYYSCGNHTFVAFYISLVLLFALSENNPKVSLNILKTNFKIILVIMMFFAALQKILSPSFISGEFLNYMFMSGSIFKFLNLNEDFIIYSSENWNQIKLFFDTSPHDLEAISYSLLFNNQLLMFKYLSIFIIVVEFLFIGVVFVKNQIFKHLFFLSFLGFTLLTRFETGFLSLICILCYSQLTSTKRWLHFLYFAFYFCCIYMIFFKMGYH